MVERIAFIEIPPTQISEEDRIVLDAGCKWNDAVFVIASGFPQPTLSEAMWVTDTELRELLWPA